MTKLNGAENEELVNKAMSLRLRSNSAIFARREMLQCSLDDFKLGVTVGTGTFGRVRLAECVKTINHPHKFFALKMLKKSQILRSKQVKHIMSEVEVLSKVQHPFIVNLVGKFQDVHRLYLVLEFVPGGELFTYLRTENRISCNQARIYAAQITLALGYLHQRNVIYRDLKPENVIMTREGYLKIADFGFAKICKDRTYTLCGTPEYLAPEIIKSEGHGSPVDWWALGVLIFEMVSGRPPFSAPDDFHIYQLILTNKLEFDSNFSSDCKSLVSAFLRVDITKRLGCLKNGVDDIKAHNFFNKTQWVALAKGEAKMPYIPKLSSDNDTTNFDKYPESLDGAVNVNLSTSEMKQFEQFDTL